MLSLLFPLCGTYMPRVAVGVATSVFCKSAETTTTNMLHVSVRANTAVGNLPGLVVTHVTTASASHTVRNHPLGHEVAHDWQWTRFTVMDQIHCYGTTHQCTVGHNLAGSQTQPCEAAL
jgi:hypothetical protein